MKYVDNKDICELVRTAEQQYTNGGGTIMSEYVTTDLYDDINKIYAYLESKHTFGDKDSKGRDKPFFNIVNSARNIYYRATDIDRKDVGIKPSKSEEMVPAFIATVHLQNWMRKEGYGEFLNKWGMELAAFNSSVIKHVESKGELHAMVVPWSRLIVDSINFDKNPKIELLELTEAELYQREGYDKEMVEKLCDALQARELADHTKQDQRSNYIKLYEIHGNLPLSYLTGKEKDEDAYVQQMHVISFVASKEEGKYDDFTLISGRESQDPYMLTSLLPSTDGSISLNGSVKNLFETQWMMNHTVKSIKDQLDLASRLIFQTSDPNFVGRNVLTAVETGDILVHAVNMPLTQVQNNSHEINSQESFGNMWKGLSAEINGISESMLGNTPPSGTAWRQVNALLQESHSLFELMTENKGLCLEAMLRTYVIPFLKKQMNTSEEIVATLEAHHITKIDSMYVPSEAIRRFNKQAVDKAIKYLETGDQNSIPSPYQADIAQAPVKQELASLGNTRFFKPSDIPTVTWKTVLKDLEWELEVNITNEATNKDTVLTTLSTALQAVANPMYANNPQAQLVVSKILSATGVISPLEISSMPPPPPMPVAPAGGAPPQALPVNAPQNAG
jgi:hypothetical protein